MPYSSCTHPVTVSTSTVDTTDATTMGHNCALTRSKCTMMATPGGTKKKPMLAMRKSVRPFTHSSLTTFSLSSSVSKSMPIMLDGSCTWARLTTNSPKARQPKIMASCLIIIS